MGIVATFDKDAYDASPLFQDFLNNRAKPEVEGDLSTLVGRRYEIGYVNDAGRESLKVVVPLDVVVKVCPLTGEVTELVKAHTHKHVWTDGKGSGSTQVSPKQASTTLSLSRISDPKDIGGLRLSPPKGGEGQMGLYLYPTNDGRQARKPVLKQYALDAESRKRYIENGWSESPVESFLVFERFIVTETEEID